MNRLFGGVLTGAVLLALPSLAIAGQQNFTLVNKTGYTLDKVFVAPSKSDSWDEDIMGKDVLANGETVDIEFDRSETTCKWDLKVVYDDATSAEWENFDLCKTHKITIHYSRGSGETSATYE